MPPYFDTYAFAPCVDPKECTWLAPNDVVVSVCGKCGTNWMMTVVHELRTWDKPHLRDFEDINLISPWAELRVFPGVLYSFVFCNA